MRISSLMMAFTFFAATVAATGVQAKLDFVPETTNDGLKFILVSGTFDHDDDLATFAAQAIIHEPMFISFQSPGGNVAKAMELGRIIRKLNLSTLQLRMLECSSACALAFMGGVNRGAEAGAIGVHKSTFSPGFTPDADVAVSVIQEMTADIVAYMVEMGVDPSLLQLSLKTEANDMRYLSREEMARYRVTWVGNATSPRRSPPPQVTDNPFHKPTAQLDASGKAPALPTARSGYVRHPKGAVHLKTSPGTKAEDAATLKNGTRITILSDSDRWYRVRADGRTGFLHHTWVRVDQFDGTPGYQRLIQIKSFDNAYDANTFARAFPLKASVFVATNGWYAVTVGDSYEVDKAIGLTRLLKSKGEIPQDSFVTLGNTYVKRVCCGE
ncbi:hypothetical protein C8N35_1011491 [Breoghania corrubedonensis]|uniref:SH3b domain-containing protein n=1 Tax=Breoghania corrubedonensis TaxID=665038 RepID=A0A2T5VI97_9HYPH|nr:SH3 domain-containing protein [Breoghania corrubedonensis]PTW63438.1 hypothetical protein C8N35_1011491 [Breoghania corrubedonensis]